MKNFTLPLCENYTYKNFLLIFLLSFSLFANAQQLLDFQNAVIVNSGAPLAVGTQYRFANVTTISGGIDVDALVTITNAQAATLTSFDDNTSVLATGISDFNPTVQLDGATIVNGSADGAFVDFRFEFVLNTDNSIPIDIEVDAYSYDVDGDGGEVREYVVISSFGSYVVNDPTQLNYLGGGRFESSTTLGNPGNTADANFLVRTNYPRIQTFTYRAGVLRDVGISTTPTLFGLAFQPISFTTEDTTVLTSDLVTQKSVDNAIPLENETITYTITVVNNGPDDATSVALTDVLPSGVTFSSATAVGGTVNSYDDGSGLWNIGDLNNGNTAILTIDATVDSGTNGTKIINQTSAAMANQTDDSSTADILRVVIRPDIDSDVDTISDIIDLDDDNDGILDTEECATNTSTVDLTGTDTQSSTGGYPVRVVGTGVSGSGTGNVEFPSTYTINTTINGNDVYEGCEFRFSFDGFDDGLRLIIDGVERLYFDQNIFDNVRGANTTEFNFGIFDLDDNNEWRPWLDEGNPELLISDGSIQLMLDSKIGRVNALPYMDSSNPNWVWDESFSLDCLSGVSFVLSNVNSAGNASITNPILTSDIFVCTDSDGDGIINRFELDSDGDGCFDVVESGGNDPDDDGIIGEAPYSYDSNGQVIGTNVTGGYNGVTGNEILPIGYTNDTTIDGVVSVNEGDTFIISSDAVATQTDVWNGGPLFEPNYAAGTATNVSNDLVYTWTFDDGSGAVVVTPTESGATGQTFDFGTITASDYGEYQVTITHLNNVCISEVRTVTVGPDCSNGTIVGTPTANDPDADGLNNSCDLDDDNDGILDSVEGRCDQPSVANSNSGSGSFQDQLYIFNWDGVDLSNGIQNGDTQTFVLPDGLSITATFSNVSNATNASSYTPTDLNTFAGAFIHQLYNTPGTQEALLGALDAHVSFRVTFTATKAGVAFPLDIIALDGEATADPEERITFTTNGGNWRLLETINTGGNFTGEGTKVLDVEDTETSGGNSIFYSENSSTIDVDILSINGRQGVAFGLYLLCDTDNDGVPNSQDLDSDNDGIYDIDEVGTGSLDSNDDGKVDAMDTPATGDTDTDGLADAIETANGPDTGTPPIDTGSDGSFDFLNLDSDGDGCSDANEAYDDPNADGGDGGQFGTTDPATVDSNGLVNETGVDYTLGTNSNVTTAGSVSITTQPVDREICVGGDTTFEAVTVNGDSYQWQIFNGTLFVDLNDTGIHSTTTSETLTITNAATSDNGNQYRLLVSSTTSVCGILISDTAILTVNSTTAGISSSDSDNTICAGDSVTFTGSGGDQYEFFVDGVSVQAQSATATYTTTTLSNGEVVTVRVVNTTTNCSAVSSGITTTVNALPTAGISSSDSDNIICAGDSVTFTGSGGDQYEFFVDGVSVQAQSATATYTTTTLSNGEVVTVRVVNTTTNCSAVSSGITTTVNALPTAGISSSDSDNTICAGDSVTFTGSGGDQYEFFVDGVSVQAQSATATYTTTTLSNGEVVTVRVVNTTTNCSAVSSGITTTVNALPTAGISSSDSDNTICAGDSVTFTGSGGDQYEFFVDGVSVQAQSATATYTTTTLSNGEVVTVRVVNTTTNCSAVSSGITTTVNALPTAGISSSDSDNTICAGDSVTFTGSGGDQYEFFVDGVSVQAQSATATYTTTTLSNGEVVTVRVVNTTTNCSAVSSGITTTVNALPTIVISTAPTCSLNSTTYELEVTVSRGTVTSTLGTVSNISGNVWRINNVTAGMDVDITVSDNGCGQTISSVTPICLDALDDTVVVDGIMGGNAIQVVNTNDVLNNNGVILGSNVFINSVNDPVLADGIGLNQATGEVEVIAGATSGNYTISYTLCSIADPSICDIATINITVTSPQFVLTKTGVTNGNTVGDEIVYTFQVLNSGNIDINNIIVDDPLLGTPSIAITPSTLAPGEQGVATATYEITQEDINTGEVINSATAIGTDSLGNGVTDVSDNGDETIDTDGDSDPTNDITVTLIEQLPNLDLVKTGVYIDVNEDGIPNAGDQVAYNFSITNNGNVTISNITLEDPLEGIVLTGAPFDLAPGETDTTTYTASYVITEWDVANGNVVNQALVRGTDPNGDEVTDLSDDPTSDSSIDQDNDGDGENETITPFGQDDGLIVYSAISANGDGSNDEFRIPGLQRYPENTLRIYNRWGVQVFAENGYEQPGSTFFTGMSTGRVTVKQEDQLPVGTYYYVLEYKNQDNETMNKVGYVYLNR
ncbi:gliding motility-associated C-terminal domain-containing protein [Aquimarina sp. W85]|uniref:DUF7507 domain-containing protein n=1 Tax=Aquimarina rhodophyticola TaxID=3342246 RepID=UPI00366DC01C